MLGGKKKKYREEKLPPKDQPLNAILRLARNHYPVSCPFVLLIQVIQ